MKPEALKGLIFDIRRFSVHDGPGIRTTVFFKGCPLECGWCHNPESRHPGPEVSEKILPLDGYAHKTTEVTGQWMTVAELFSEIRRDALFYDQSEGGVTFSGGEPFMQPGFLKAILSECKEAGIQTAIDTSGYAGFTDILEAGELTDLFLYDLKLADDEDHLKYTGVSNTSIIDNLRYLLSAGKPVQIRIPIVPGITGTQKNINGLINLIHQLNRTPLRGISLLPYHTLGQRKYHRFNIDTGVTGIKNIDPVELQPHKKSFEALGVPVTIGF